MASIRTLKKKIHQQSLQVLLTALVKSEQDENAINRLQTLSEEINDFSLKSIQRINNCKYWQKAEKKAEIKSIQEQVRDKFVSLGN